jgi:hypothetical protein
VCPKSTADLPKISTFRNWLLAEAEQDASAAYAEPGKRVRRAG